MNSNLTSSLPDEPHIQSPHWALPFPWPPLYLFPLLTCRFSHCPYTWLARWFGITGISDILTSSTNSPSLSLVLEPGFWILSISCYSLRPMCLPDLFLFTSCLFGHAQHLKLSSKYTFIYVYIYKEKQRKFNHLIHYPPTRITDQDDCQLKYTRIISITHFKRGRNQKIGHIKYDFHN